MASTVAPGCPVHADFDPQGSSASSLATVRGQLLTEERESAVAGAPAVAVTVAGGRVSTF
jgi:hypothetical protein